MGEDTSLWIFGGLIAWMSAGTIALWIQRGEVKQLRLAVELFVKGMGDASLEVLHSPTDHLGIDAIIEQYQTNRHKLTYAQWMTLGRVCKRLIDDKNIPDDIRLAAGNSLAALMAELVLHKMNITVKEFDELIKSGAVARAAETDQSGNVKL